MTKFLIEVPHPEERTTCLQVSYLLAKMGSHYLDHCDWGCIDGEAKSWIVVEVDSRDEALRIIPPMFRARARVTPLERFSRERVAAMATAVHTA